jgi:hypothetical protein
MSIILEVDEKWIICWRGDKKGMVNRNEVNEGMVKRKEVIELKEIYKLW